ncbi:tRNA (adenosine(37)-N6)-threonylcarbamoyltransferase complex ATPase subunit type 1 TsaE, partial [Candidatus Daviesbacteria bacterium]|nr:tRNA (adenosine(37)-N6)-threonylcarbamoyltransferase complex ATPase subunit type 1 TsaE [Candidatus Daviesbacteria bacterium]
TFVQGFAQGLGIKDKIISPTFILIRIHKVPKTDQKLYHIDLYRIEGAINTAALGLDEIFTNKSNIVLIEWAEKLGSKLPQAAIKININDLGRDKREIRVNS